MKIHAAGLPGRHSVCRRSRPSCASRACWAAGLACLLSAAWDRFELAGFAAAAPRAKGSPPVASQQSRKRPHKTALAALDTLEAISTSTDSLAAASSLPGGLEASVLMAFADQGQNINGVLFQASLLPYLMFLYFLGYKRNNTPPLVQFAFAFLLAFVVSTIPSGLIAKSTYGVILADSDWLHGAAESLLTCTNILLVLGFRGGLTGDGPLSDSGAARAAAGLWLVVVVLTIAAGVPLFGWEAHTPFLAGLGAMPAGLATAAEPANALSVPTWVVHWSTVFEWVLAMSLAWRYADVTGNPRWKGLAWAMLPSHVSSCAALTFHVFYNQLAWVLTAQAFCTCLGNITLAIAAMRIAVSNGWTLDELNPFKRVRAGATAGEPSTVGATGESGGDSGFDVAKLAAPLSSGELVSTQLLAAEIISLSVVFSLATKYGELAIQLFQTPGAEASFAAAILVLGPSSLVAYSLYGGSGDLQRGSLPSLFVPMGAAAAPERGGKS